jgi:hypothetical protein
VEALASCRVNPDLKAPVRKDLEFFIPQLCSFYMQGYFDNSEPLVSLLVQASEQDFNFSHRIWFFFKSVLFNKDTEKEEQ